MKNRNSIENIGEILSVLEDMKRARIIEKYAIGGAFAAILHYEPIATIDLDIFFFCEKKMTAGFLDEEKLFDILDRHDLRQKWNKEKWRFADEE